MADGESENNFKIMVSYNSSVIFVKDIEVSKKLYIDLLDQEIEFDFGKNIGFIGGLSLWEMRSDHIISQKTISDSRYNNCELYFETDNLGETYKKLKNASVQFLHEIHEEQWGQLTIRFFDPDHHLVEIGETMETFVLRLYYQKLSVDEISQKTSVPVPIIEQIIQNTQILF